MTRKSFVYILHGWREGRRMEIPLLKMGYVINWRTKGTCFYAQNPLFHSAFSSPAFSYIGWCTMFWKIFQAKILRWNEGDEGKKHTHTKGSATVCWTHKLKRNSARVLIFTRIWYKYIFVWLVFMEPWPVLQLDLMFERIWDGLF